MASLRLQTKFLLTVTLVTAGLTATALIVVQRSVQRKVRAEIVHDLENSVVTFQNFQAQRQAAYSQSAELLADLPNVRALMTTRDASTIQDASRSIWRLSRSDVFLLADSSGRVMALHSETSGLNFDGEGKRLPEALGPSNSPRWWQDEGHVYEVFVQPIYFGDPASERLLGYLALGYELNSRIADEISRVAAAQVVFGYEAKVVTSTLAAPQQAEFLAVLPSFQSGSASRPSEIRLADEHFLGTSVMLPPASSPAVQLTVLKSLDQATAFLNNLNRELIGLGIVAVLGGSLLVFLISRTFTKPLESLVAGVRALEQGNYVFPIEPKGKDEVSEVTVAFERMRGSLQKTQRELLDAEKLATIGRMASSISHDLRHSLAAILANAEFMCEGGLSSAQREELYQEVRLAVNQMTDLIEALLEFSRTRESLHPSFGSVQLTVQRAIQVVKSHPDYHDVKIEMTCIGNNDGWFDAKRMERVFQNLLLNACEAVPADGGLVQVSLGQSADGVEVLVTDNGPGIAFPVRHTLFEPFVSYAKENGTGLGLTVVQKIVQDHGGEIAVQSSSAAGTVFRVYVPLNGAPERVASAGK